MTATLKNPFTHREREVMRPRKPMLAVDWAEKNVIVADGEAKGPFRRETMPVLTSVINGVDDPRYETEVAVASTQSGKSLGLNQIRMGYWLEHKREPSGYGIPNRKIGQRIWKTKLKPMFQYMPALFNLLPEGGAGSRGGFPTEQILKNGALWMFLGAGSEADMSQATLKNLLVDETDKADEESGKGDEATPIHQMRRRTDAYQLTRKLVYTCTVTTEKGFIWQAYQSGTRGKPYFRCRECGEWFWFEWTWEKQLVGWEDDTSEVSAMQTAYYPCPHCAHKIREEERLQVLRFPLWVHEGEQIAECTKEEVENKGDFDEAVTTHDGKSFKTVGERRQVRTVSFWWNRLTSRFTTLGHIAAALRGARDDETAKHDICIYDMAMPYAGRIIDTSELTIDGVLQHMRYSDYKSGRRGLMPFRFDQKKVLVTGGIDIGKRELYGVFDAWEVDSKGYLEKSWRLAYLIPYRYPHADDPDSIYRALEHVRGWLMKGWKDCDGKVFYPKAVAIDTGYQHGKKRSRGEKILPSDYQIYRFCKRYGNGVWRPFDGRDTLGGVAVVERTFLENHRVMFWAVDTDLIKSELHDMIRIQPGNPGFFHIPVDTPRDYARGLCAERRVVEFDKYNREHAAWVLEDAFNHPGDAEVYSWALARSFGVKPPRVAEARIIENEEEKENVEEQEPQQKQQPGEQPAE